MRRFRLLSVLILLMSAGLFGYFKYQEIQETDWAGPVVNAPTDVLEVSIKTENKVLLEGVTATDIKDGDVTDTLVVDNISGFIDGERRIITYTAFDSDKNVGKATRQMRYTDYTSPRFSLKKPFVFVVSQNIDILEGISAEDCIEGDISRNIHLSKGYSVDTESTGTQEIRFEVTNSLGDTALLPVTIRIYESSELNQVPSITLDKYIVYTEKGKHPDYASNVTAVSFRNEQLTPDMVTVNDSGVNYDKKGVYEVIYSVQNKDGIVGTVPLIVVVQ